MKRPTIQDYAAERLPMMIYTSPTMAPASELAFDPGLTAGVPAWGATAPVRLPRGNCRLIGRTCGTCCNGGINFRRGRRIAQVVSRRLVGSRFGGGGSGKRFRIPMDTWSYSRRHAKAVATGQFKSAAAFAANRVRKRSAEAEDTPAAITAARDEKPSFRD